MTKILLTLCLWFASTVHASTFDAVVSGKKCSEQESQQLDCEYRIGSDLWTERVNDFETPRVKRLTNREGGLLGRGSPVWVD
jgi:hypothetical protein